MNYSLFIRKRNTKGNWQRVSSEAYSLDLARIYFQDKLLHYAMATEFDVILKVVKTKQLN